MPNLVVAVTAQSSKTLLSNCFINFMCSGNQKKLYVVGKNIENETEVVWLLCKRLVQPQIDYSISSSQLKRDVQKLGKALWRDVTAILQQEQ